MVPGIYKEGKVAVGNRVSKSDSLIKQRLEAGEEGRSQVEEDFFRQITTREKPWVRDMLCVFKEKQEGQCDWSKQGRSSLEGK